MEPKPDRTEAFAAVLHSRVSAKLGDIWWAFLLRGVFALALGVSALLWPRLTLGLLVRLIGVYALLDGVAGLSASFRDRELQLYLPPALVSMAVGVILLLWPGITIKGLLVLLGVFVLVQGAHLFLAGYRAGYADPNRRLLIMTGSVAAAVGLILIVWPEMGVVTISWLVAALALVIGAALTFLALRLRRVKLRVDSLAEPSR